MLPPEILLDVFHFLKVKELKECQKVCKSWHNPAKIKLYNEIVVNTDMNNYNLLYSLQTNGHLVKQVQFERLHPTPRNTSTSQLRTLLRYCPNVESVMSIGPRLEVAIFRVLLSLPHQSLSKLQRIPHVAGNLQYSLCANRFKESLTELYLVHDRIDVTLIEAIKGFQKLVSLIMRRPLQDINRFDSLLDACPKLTYLSLVVILQSVREPQVFMPLKTLSTIDGGHKLQRLVVKATVNANFNFTHLYAILSRFKSLKSLSLVIRHDQQLCSVPHTLNSLPKITKIVNGLQDAEIYAKANHLFRFPTNSTIAWSQFVVSCVQSINKAIYQQQQHQITTGWINYACMTISKETISAENYMSYKTSSRLKRREIQVKMSDKTLTLSTFFTLIQHISYFANSLLLEFPRHYNKTTAADTTTRVFESLLPALLPKCIALIKLSVTGGIFTSRIQSACIAWRLRELHLNNLLATTEFLNSIPCNFPHLEKLSIGIDMKQVLQDKGISITLTKNSGLKQIAVEPQNFRGLLAQGDMPWRQLFVITLKLTGNNNSRPLIYFYCHTIGNRVSQEPAKFDIKVEINNLESFLFVFDGETRVSWQK